MTAWFWRSTDARVLQSASDIKATIIAPLIVPRVKIETDVKNFNFHSSSIEYVWFSVVMKTSSRRHVGCAEKIYINLRCRGPVVTFRGTKQSDRISTDISPCHIYYYP
jgi:hypothetical protein